MDRIDFVKRHQSHGAYERLVELGKDAHWAGHAPSVEAGVEAACHANPALAELVLDPNAARDPQWPYLGVIKAAMGYVDREALQAAHINTAYRLNPTFARQVGRGDLLQPLPVQKAAPDPLPRGQTATEALANETQRLVQKGMAPAEAQHQATAEHPTWYATYLHESRGR